VRRRGTYEQPFDLDFQTDLIVRAHKQSGPSFTGGVQRHCVPDKERSVGRSHRPAACGGLVFGDGELGMISEPHTVGAAGIGAR
jgi:hypothetical protein